MSPYAEVWAGEKVWALFGRHHRGDWGVVPQREKERNERMIEEGGEIISVYLISDRDAIVVITTAGHHVTVVERVTREQLNFAVPQDAPIEELYERA